MPLPRSLPPIALSASLLPLLSACGSVVLTEPTGGGGTAGSGVTSTATSSTSTSTSISTSSSTSTALPDPGVRLAQGSEPRCIKEASGTVTCYQDPTLPDGVPGPATVPGISDAVAVVGASQVGCVLHAGGQVSCWGDSDEGQLGLAVPIGQVSDTPVVLPEVSLIRLAGHSNSLCGIEPSGRAVCWGYVPSLKSASQSPVPVPGIDDAVEIAVSGERACAVRQGGSVWCWGYEDPAPVPGVSGATSVAVADLIACAIVEGGKVVCWNAGEEGLVTVKGVDDAVQLSATNPTVCARRASGKVSWWGYGITPDTHVNLVGMEDIIDATATSNGVCVVRSSGPVECWDPPAGIVPFPN